MKFLFAFLSATSAFAQLNSQAIVKPSADSWPTFNGDYSGKRFSPLKQINDSNVHTLALSWSTRIAFGGGGGRGLSIKSTPLLVNGIL